MSYGLSKTKILYGLQCPKRLWLEVHQPELAQYSELSAQLMQAGNEVHRAYRKLVPDGILVEHVDDLNAALEQTRLILSESAGAPVFEGAFQHNGVLVRADLIFPVSTGSRLVEVKAAGSVKDYHIQDCAIQTWVIEGAGIPIKTIELAVIDKSFVYPGGGDYRGLFRHEDVTESVRILIPQVPEWVRECRKVLESAMPVVGVGDQCRNPYACPFLEHCSVKGDRHTRSPAFLTAEKLPRNLWPRGFLIYEIFPKVNSVTPRTRECIALRRAAKRRSIRRSWLS